MRLYLPIFLLVLVAMVVFLPISGGWLSNRAEREIRKRIGLDVGIEHLELTIASAFVEAEGIAIRGDDPNSPPFRVGRLRLDGSLSALLGGGNRWPESIHVDNVAPVQLVRAEQGLYRLEGPAETLLHELTSSPMRQPGTPKPAADTGATPPRAGRIAHTPEIVIRGVPVEIEPPAPNLPPMRIMIEEVVMEERTGENAPIRMTLRGIATADSIEKFFLRALYFPSERRLAVEGDLSGLAIPFTIPGLDRFMARGRNLSVEIDVQAPTDGPILAGATARAAQSEVARQKLGGERWTDEQLEARLRVSFDPGTNLLVVDQASLLGEQVDVRVAGSATLSGDVPGEVRLRVLRLPAAAVALGRTELAERRAIAIDATSDTTPTLRLELDVAGNLAQPESLRGSGSLRVAGWTLQAPEVPAPLEITDINLVGSPDEITLRSVKLEIGGLALEARGIIPVLRDGGTPRWGSISVEAQGDAESAVEMLEGAGLLPDDLSYLRAPVSLTAAIPVRLAAGAGGTMDVQTDLPKASASFLWREGELGLRRFTDPVVLRPGSLRYRDGVLNLQRLRAAFEGLEANINGTLSGDLTNPTLETVDFEGGIILSGPMEQALFLLQRGVSIPSLPDDLSGDFQLDLRVAAEGNNLLEPKYRLRLLLDQVQATIATPHRTVPLRDVSAEIVVDNQAAQLRRLQWRVVDMQYGTSSGELSASLTDQRLRVDGSVRTRLEYLPALLPKDLNELVMEGLLPASGWGVITPTQPLPQEPDLIRRWIAYLKAEKPTIGPGDDRRLNANWEIVYRQQEPVTVFPRDFPVRMENMRGNARFTPEGIRITDALIDVGTAKDVQGSALIQLQRPTKITFDARANALDVNEWLDGWGERPWASAPVSFEPRWKTIPTSYQFVDINGRITTNSLKFLQFTAENTASDFHFEAWSRDPARLDLRNLTSRMYGGGATADLSFVFPRGERPILDLQARYNGVEIDGFLDQLLERDQSLDGLLTGRMTFKGQLLNYPTYEGEGEFRVEQSSVIGKTLFPYARDLLSFASRTGGRDSRITGKGYMREEKVHFTELFIFNPNINLTADGYVDFRAALFFDVTASVISKRLKEIPLISIIGQAVDFLGNEVVTYRVRGTLKDPQYYPIPTLMTRLETLRRILQVDTQGQSPAGSPAPSRTRP